VALLARDQHADQAEGGIGAGDVDIGPAGMTLDGEPLARPRGSPSSRRACARKRPEPQGWTFRVVTEMGGVGLCRWVRASAPC
jgi:hypothetical protein